MEEDRKLRLFAVDSYVSLLQGEPGKLPQRFLQVISWVSAVCIMSTMSSLYNSNVIIMRARHRRRRSNTVIGLKDTRLITLQFAGIKWESRKIKEEMKIQCTLRITTGNKSPLRSNISSSGRSFHSLEMQNIKVMLKTGLLDDEKCLLRNSQDVVNMIGK